MSIQALSPNNLPQPVLEEWKYTNLPRAIPKGLREVEADTKIIHAKRGETGGKPVEVLWTGRDGALENPRLKIILEEGSELTVIERHEGNGAYWKNMTSEIMLSNDAKLRHIRIQKDDFSAVQTNIARISLGKGAVYDGFTLNQGAKLSRNQVHAVIEGAGAECSINGMNLFGGAQHGDTTILIEHRAPRCRSNQFYRSILNDQARCVFQGKIHVHKAAQKTDGYQLSNAILLSEGAEMDVKPELEIYADDVKCSHGSTVGQLDEGPLFYLRSRGLSEKEARILLMRAFLDEIVDKIGDEGVREEVRGRAHLWLQAAL